MTDEHAGRARALRDARGFGRLWSASTVSAFGSFVTTFAVPVLVVDVLAGDAVDVGLVNAARWVPYLVLGLLAGVLVDRVRRRPLLVVTDLLSALVLGAIPLLSATGHLEVAWLVVLMVVFGLCTLVGDAAFQAFVPRVVPTTLLGPAHARLDQSDAVAQVSGPALAGGLVRWLGAPLTVLVDAVTFLASAVLLATIRVDEPAVARRTKAWSVWAEVRDGVRWVYAHPTLRPLALVTHVWFACSAVVGAVTVPFAYRTLHLSAGTLGLALSAAGVGALAGASVAVRLGRRFGAGRVIVVARFGSAVAWGLMALAAVAVPEPVPPGGWGGGAPWVVFALGQLVFGLSLGAENTNELAYRQTATPDELQGRMNATMRSINRAMIVVAAPLGGLLGDAAGYSTALVVAGGVLVVAVAVTVGSRLWRAHLGDEHTSPADAG